MSLISESLKRVAEQRAGRKEPPTVPRAIAGGGLVRRGRLLVVLGLTMLLAGLVIGVVIFGVIQRQGRKKDVEKAPKPVPQQVIFDKISPPPPEPERDERTPAKPTVVQVAIEQKTTSTDGDAKSPAPQVSKVQAEDQPLQTSKKVKVGLVSEHSAEQDVDKKESLWAEEDRRPGPGLFNRKKAEQIAALDSSKESEPIMITVEQQQAASRAKKTRKIDLRAESTVGSVALYREAVSYQKAMKWSTAIETYKKVLKFEPMSAEIYNNIGVCYEKMGELEMAAKSYEKAISINPRFYRSYNNLGIIHHRMKDFNKARAAYEQALLLNPSNSQSEVNLALVYERLHRPELARRTLKQVLVNDPRNAEAHYNLARMLEDQGQHKQALSHYRQFLASKSSAYPQLREKVQGRVRVLEEASSK